MRLYATRFITHMVFNMITFLNLIVWWKCRREYLESCMFSCCTDYYCIQLIFREQEQEEILRARLGRRDSAAQITTISPPTEVFSWTFIIDVVLITYLAFSRKGFWLQLGLITTLTMLLYAKISKKMNNASLQTACSRIWFKYSIQAVVYR